MWEAGRSRTCAIGNWTAAAVILGLAIVAGYSRFTSASEQQVAVPLAFAGGAVLASVIDTVP